MAVYLGKTMMDGWYGVPENLSERVQALFDYVHDECDEWNDFRLAVEDETYMPGTTDKWRLSDLVADDLVRPGLLLRLVAKEEVKT
jgi:hypothetical protein